MIKSKSELVSTINSELADNSIGDISPRDIRHNLIDIIDSVHNLIAGQAFDTAHYGTPDKTSVRLGKESLSKLDLVGYSTSGNTAIGFSALQNTYQSVRNTALGAYSLNCNIHGYDNVGAGYSSLAGNTTGYANVGIGAYTLQNNKLGDFNIAIGHGAGYYADRITNNKLYIGSHNVDSDYICANAEGVGLVPLVYGDMSENSLGINVRELHTYGKLQTSGNITSSVHKKFSVGHNQVWWNEIYGWNVLTHFLKFAHGQRLSANSSGILNSGHFAPAHSGIYELGRPSLPWKNLYVENFNAISGVTSHITNHYDKIFYVSSSGDGNGYHGYLTQEQLAGSAGFGIRASGSTNPEWLFDYSASTCGVPFRRWQSNVGIEIMSGQRFMGSHWVSPETPCVGLHWNSGQLFHSTKSAYEARETIAGSGNVNFIKDKTSTEKQFTINYLSENGGCDIAQRFITFAANKQQDQGEDKLHGFVQKFHDMAGHSLTTSDNLNRFTTSAYNSGINPTNCMILMQENQAGGVFGINDFSGGDGTLGIPKTIFNVRSTTNASARITSETTGDTKTSLQLMGECNDLADGLELQFGRTGNFGDFNVYQNSGVTNFIRLTPSGNSAADPRMAIFSSGNINTMLTLGSSDNNKAALAIHKHPSTEPHTSNYGKIYVSTKSGSATQSLSLNFVDDTGNHFDLITNPCDSNEYETFNQDGTLVIGSGSLTTRCNLVNPHLRKGNTVVGSVSAPVLVSGEYNTIFGSYNSNTLSIGDKNVVLGYNNLYNASSSLSNSIVIGNSIGAPGTRSSTLLIGTTTPIVSGDLITNDLFIPNGNLTVVGNSNSIILSPQDNSGKSFSLNYDDTDFSFKFSPSDFKMLTMSSGVGPMSQVGSYGGGSDGATRPRAELKGDLRLLGALRFRDGTSFETASDLNYVSGVANSNASKLDNVFVEGYASGDISVAASYNSPSTGKLLNFSDTEVNYTLTNRDRHTKILQNDFVIAIKIGSEYRPIWVSNENSVCTCCAK
jgi:hypothetical protein